MAAVVLIAVTFALGSSQFKLAHGFVPIDTWPIFEGNGIAPLLCILEVENHIIYPCIIIMYIVYYLYIHTMYIFVYMIMYVH